MDEYDKAASPKVYQFVYIYFIVPNKKVKITSIEKQLKYLLKMGGLMTCDYFSHIRMMGGC